jgi:hypothetical protein
LQYQLQVTSHDYKLQALWRNCGETAAKLWRNRGETTAKPQRNRGENTAKLRRKFIFSPQPILFQMFHFIASYEPQLQVTSPSYKLQAKVTSYKPCGETAAKIVFLTAANIVSNVSFSPRFRRGFATVSPRFRRSFAKGLVTCNHGL